eukprot:84395_1
MTLSQNSQMLLSFVLLLQCMITDSKVSPQDIEALQDLYNATNGPNWYWFKWDPDTLNSGNVCELHGVTCNRKKTRVTEISLVLNGLTGTIPYSIGQLSALQKLALTGNELFGSIPPTIVQLQSLTELKVNVNTLSGTIPGNIGQMTHLKTLNLGTNKLSGTVPESIGNLTEITDFEIEYNHISGTIPPSVGNLNNLQFMLWQNNKLEGTIPTSLGNKSHLTSLTLSHNALTGPIPDSLGLFPKIKDFFLNDNDLYSNNFGQILSKLLRTTNALANYKSIQVHNNPRLGGDLSALENMGNVSLYSFTAFNCDLYGTIPKTIQFHRVGEFYIWGNRLSGELPQDLVYLDRSSAVMAQFSPVVVLQSNLFWIKSITSQPSWLSSYDSFASASLLYYTRTDEIVSYIVVTFTAVCILFLICTSNRNNDPQANNSKQGHLLEAHPMSDAFFGFFANLEFVQAALNHWSLLVITIALLIFYPLNSTYFECAPILSKLSLGYYMPRHKYCDWILVTLFALFYICLWSTILKAQTEQFKQDEEYKSAPHIPHLGLDIANQPHLPAPQDSNTNLLSYNAPPRNDDQNSGLPISVTEDQSNANNQSVSEPPRPKCAKCAPIATMWVIFWFLFYLCLFLGLTAFVVLSIIFESLPEHNTFERSSRGMKALQYLMAMFLTVNTALVIPNFVDCSFALIQLCCKSDYRSETNYLTHCRPLIILFLRSMSTIIIPTITSMFLLNDCGKYWTYFWVECYPSNQSQFDANIGKQYVYLTAHSVCDPIPFQDVKWDKCIRSFSTKWSFVIIQKLFYMILMPVLMIGFKPLQHKLYAKYQMFKNHRVKQENICFDMEYTMILTKCESMIIFGVISPFIIPLTICSVNSNYFIYRNRIEKKNWRIKQCDKNILFPIYFLWIGVFISQFFVCCFVYECLDNVEAFGALIGVLVVIDVMFIGNYMRYKRTIMSQRNMGSLQAMNSNVISINRHEDEEKYGPIKSTSNKPTINN